MTTGLFPGQPVSGLAMYSSKEWLNRCSWHTQTQPMCTLEVCKLKDMQKHARGHTQSHSTWPAEGLVSEKIARLPAVTLHLLSWHIVRWQTGHHAETTQSHHNGWQQVPHKANRAQKDISGFFLLTVCEVCYRIYTTIKLHQLSLHFLLQGSKHSTSGADCSYLCTCSNTIPLQKYCSTFKNTGVGTKSCSGNDSTYFLII